MQTVDSDIRGIRQHFDFRADMCPGLLEKAEIMLLSDIESRANDASAVFIYYNLRFYRMTLLFAGIITLLFFFGR
jgi:hypothetical protein